MPPPFLLLIPKSPVHQNFTFLSLLRKVNSKQKICHQFQSDKIAFNPNPTFVTNLWNSAFFWILPSSPSGVSVSYFQETKSTNANKLEKEQYLAFTKLKLQTRKIVKTKDILTNNTNGPCLYDTELSSSNVIVLWPQITLFPLPKRLDKPHL